MTKTTRRERRKRAVASGAAEARGVSKGKAKKHTSSGSNHISKNPASAGGLVGKDGKQLVKRPVARKQQRDGGKSAQNGGVSGRADGRKKKRPRSEVEEDDEEGEQGDSQPLVVDELVATIQEHDQFFSRMLDMIPEHLVLPAKEVTESSYASKYMKNKKGEAPQQSKKEESKKNKRARYAANNQKTLLERQQERAKSGEDDGPVDDDGQGGSDGDDDEGLEAAAEQDGLQGEVLRGKNMDVASMDALKQRIEERIKKFQEKRTAAEGSRRAKTAAKRSAQNATKRENKRKGAKAKKKGREGAIAATAAKGGLAVAGEANGSMEGANGTSKGASAKKVKGSKPEANGSHAEVANPQLPPLPTVEDVGDIEFSGLRGVVGDGSSGGNRSKHGLPKTGAPGSKMKRLHGLLAAAEEKKQRLAGLRQTEEGKLKAKEEGWADAIRVAGGAEVKDNPAALKKMIKRKEKEKAKSAAKWDDRMSGQRKEQSKRQDKREENLNRRKRGAAATAAADAEKGEAGGDGKRQRRAGFEGKKQDFINKERPNKAGAQDGGSR